MHIPTMANDTTFHLEVACCFWLLNKFVPSANFCVWDTFRNISCDIDTALAKALKKEASKTSCKRGDVTNLQCKYYLSARAARLS